MLKKPFFNRFHLSALSLVIALAACGYKERDTDSENETATSTGNFYGPLELENVGDNPLAFQWGDVTNDGASDLILLNSLDNADAQGFRILSRTGANTTTDASTLFSIGAINLTSDKQPTHLLVSDFVDDPNETSDDGVQDILVVHPLDDTYSLWKGTRSGQNYSAIEVNLGNKGLADYPSYIAPYTYGTKVGAAFVSRGARQISIFFEFNYADLIAGKGADVELKEADGLGKDPIQMVALSWDNEGCSDLAVLSRNDERIDLYQCTLVNDNPSFSKLKDVSVGGDPQAIISGHWDNDGFIDLAVTNQADDKITLLYGDGAGGFRLETIGVGDQPGQIASGDLNNDGQMDFIVGNSFDKDLSMLLSDGSGREQTDGQTVYTREDLAISTIPTGSRPSYVSIQDITADGKNDILVSLPTEKKMSFLLQK